MGLKKVYLGDFNNDKKDMLIDKCVDYLEENKGNNFIYILPNGSLLTRYRKKLIDRVEIVRGMNIYTFDDVADRLAKRVNRKMITDEIKLVIIDDIVEDLYRDGKLVHYKNMVNKSGFIKNTSDIISQMKSSLIKSQEYLEGIGHDRSFLEIGYIYREYENKLKKYKMMDKDDKFLDTIDGLKENYEGFLEDIDFIIIDEFYDFRPQEMAIIEEISKLDIDIHINVPFFREENFDSLLDTIEHLENIGFEIERVEKPSKNSFEELSNSIFSAKTRLERNDDISLIKAPTKKLEIKKIAEFIKREVRGGLSLEDIAIVMTSDNYKNIIDEVFEEEKIPHSQSIEESLVDIPLLREVFYLLENSIKRDKKSFINRLKSRYFSLCSFEYIEEIEYNFRNRCLDLEDLLELHISEEIDGEIEKILDRISREDELLLEGNTIKEYSKILLDIIDSYKLEDKIYEIYLNTGDYEVLNRDLSALEIILNYLENIIDLDDELFNYIDLEDFVELLSGLMLEGSITTREGNNGGVKLLTPAMIRGHRYKAVFIVGLTQGEYPKLSSKNFFFKDENSELFEKINLDYKNYYQKLDKESLNFTIALSQVEERLYLSYSENITDNEAGIASIFLDELLYSIEGERLEDKLNLIEVDMDYGVKKELDSVTSLDDFSYYMLNKEENSPEEYSKLNYLDGNRLEKILVKSEGEGRRLKGLDEYSGVLRDKKILEDINKNIDGKSFSISYLENYGKCPYYFMLKNLLRIDDLKRDIEEFTKLDRGIINHSILQDYYSNHEKDIENYVLKGEELDLDYMKDYLTKRYEEGIETRELDLSNPIYKLKIETNVDKILEYILSDLDRLKNYKEKLLPVSYESEFGRSEDFYIESRGKKIKFTGVIDRIDKFVDKDKYIVMDYKNTSYGVATDEEVLAGTSLQMPIYIISQRDKNVVGAVYGVISNKDIEILLIDDREKSIIGRKRRGVYSEEEIDNILDMTKNYIGEYVEAIGRGDFRVAPKECSDYCEYRDICRVRKEEGVEFDG